MSVLTPNMSLIESTINVDSGLAWETNLNASLTVLDGHNHSPGSGVQINPSGLNINADLPMGGNNLTNARSVRFNAQTSPLAVSTDIGCLYVSGLDLWFNDESGNQIRMTQGGSVLSTSSGISSGSASAAFSSGVLVVDSASNTPANIQVGSVLVGNTVANSKFVTLSPTGTLGSNYSLSLPLIPGATSFLGIDTSGNIAAGPTLSGGITGANIVSNVNLPGSAVQENGRNVIVSSTNASTTSLAVLRGRVSSTGSILAGEGFTVNHVATGQYIISFTNVFTDQAVTTVTPTVLSGTPGAILSAFPEDTTTPMVGEVLVQIINSSAALTDSAFNFTTIGQR